MGRCPRRDAPAGLDRPAGVLDRAPPRGRRARRRDQDGNDVVDDSFLILLNGGRTDVTFVLPSERWGSKWSACIDTTKDAITEADATLSAAEPVKLVANSAMVL